MLQSIVVTSAQDADSLTQSIKIFYDKCISKKITFGDECAYIRYNELDHIDNYLAKNETFLLLLIGRITNLSTLRYGLLSSIDNALTSTPAQFLLDLYSLFGKAGFTLLDGEFSIFIRDNHALKIYTDHFGVLPLHFLIDKAGQFWITNEIKSILTVDTIDFSLKELHDIRPNKDNASSFGYFKKISKIPPGCECIIDMNNNGYTFKSSYYLEYSFAVDKNIHKNIAIETLDKLLHQAIQETTNTRPIGVALSGGLDSSLIAAITKQHAYDVHTFSMGTADGNEFSSSKLVSDFLGTTHHEIMFDTKELSNAMLQTIFYNEVISAICVEVHLAFWIFLQGVSPYTSTLFTGFGADMLFTGRSSVDDSPYLLQKNIQSHFMKVQWRGEYVPFVVQKHHIDVNNSFCSSKVIAFVLSLDPSLKIFDKQVKYILRELAHTKKYIPKEICYRQKIALEEATSINKLFSAYLNTGKHSDLDEKRLFTYFMFKEIFEHKKSLSDIDPNLFIKND